jgi:hypothetical protein
MHFERLMNLSFFEQRLVRPATHPPATHNTAGKVASQAQKNRFRPKYQNTKK